MRKGLLWFIGGGIVGGAAGFAAAVFAYPYIFLADIVADDPPPEGGAGPVVARGEFVHADPNDPIHYGSGRVTVYRDVVRLEEDFEVGPGPAYHVYLVSLGDVRRSADVEGSEIVDLGALRAFKGAQNYRIPDGVTLADYRSVVIWCEDFSVLISPATVFFED